MIPHFLTQLRPNTPSSLRIVDAGENIKRHKQQQSCDQKRHRKDSPPVVFHPPSVGHFEPTASPRIPDSLNPHFSPAASCVQLTASDVR